MQTQSKRGRTSAILAQLREQDLKLIKVAIRRHNIPETPNPPPVVRTLENPADLVLHRRGEGQHPIFDREDIVVNQEEFLEERVVLHSPAHTSNDDRRQRSESRTRSTYRGRSRDSNSTRSSKRRSSSRSRSKSYSPPKKKGKEHDSDRDRSNRHKSRSKEKLTPDLERIKDICPHNRIRTDLLKSPALSNVSFLKSFAANYKAKETDNVGKQQDHREKDDQKLKENSDKYKDEKKAGAKRTESPVTKEKFRSHSRSPREGTSRSYETERERYYREKERERRIHDEKSSAEKERERRKSPPPGMYPRRSRSPVTKRRSRSPNSRRYSSKSPRRRRSGSSSFPSKRYSRSPSPYLKRRSRSPEYRGGSSRSIGREDSKERYRRYSRSPARKEDPVKRQMDRRYSRSPDRRREGYRGLPERRSPYRGPPERRRSPYRGPPDRRSPRRGSSDRKLARTRSPYRHSPYKGPPERSSPYRGPSDRRSPFRGPRERSPYRSAASERNRSPHREERGYKGPDRSRKDGYRGPKTSRFPSKQEPNDENETAVEENEYKGYIVPEFEYYGGQQYWIPGPMSRPPFGSRGVIPPPMMYPPGVFRGPIMIPRIPHPMHPGYRPRLPTYNRPFRPKLPPSATAPTTATPISSSTPNQSSSVEKSSSTEASQAVLESSSKQEKAMAACEAQVTTSSVGPPSDVPTVASLNTSFSETTTTDSETLSRETSFHSDNVDSTVTSGHAVMEPLTEKSASYLVEEPEDESSPNK